MYSVALKQLGGPQVKRHSKSPLPFLFIQKIYHSYTHQETWCGIHMPTYLQTFCEMLTGMC